jgi:hypothetical protein
MATECPDFEEYDQLVRAYRRTRAQCQASLDQLQAAVREMTALCGKLREDLELHKAERRGIKNRGRQE